MKPFPVTTSLKRGGTLHFNPGTGEFIFISKNGTETRGNLAFELEQVLPGLPDVFTADDFTNSYIELGMQEYPDCRKLEKKLSYRLSFLMGLGIIERISPYGAKPWQFKKKTPDFLAKLPTAQLEEAPELPRNEAIDAIIGIVGEARYHQSRVVYHSQEVQKRLELIDARLSELRRPR